MTRREGTLIEHLTQIASSVQGDFIVIPSMQKVIAKRAIQFPLGRPALVKTWGEGPCSFRQRNHICHGYVKPGDWQSRARTARRE